RIMMPSFQTASVHPQAAEIARMTAAAVARWPVDEVVDVATLARQLTLCIAVSCLFGLDVTTGASELGRLAESLQHEIASPIALLLPYAIPGTPFRRALRVSEQLVAKMQELIEDRKSTRLNSSHDQISYAV